MPDKAPEDASHGQTSWLSTASIRGGAPGGAEEVVNLWSYLRNTRSCAIVLMWCACHSAVPVPTSCQLVFIGGMTIQHFLPGRSIVYVARATKLAGLADKLRTDRHHEHITPSVQQVGAELPQLLVQYPYKACDSVQVTCTAAGCQTASVSLCVSCSARETPSLTPFPVFFAEISPSSDPRRRFRSDHPKSRKSNYRPGLHLVTPRRPSLSRTTVPTSKAAIEHCNLNGDSEPRC